MAPAPPMHASDFMMPLDQELDFGPPTFDQPLRQPQESLRSQTKMVSAAEFMGTDAVLEPASQPRAFDSDIGSHIGMFVRVMV